MLQKKVIIDDLFMPIYCHLLSLSHPESSIADSKRSPAADFLFVTRFVINSRRKVRKRRRNEVASTFKGKKRSKCDHALELRVNGGAGRKSTLMKDTKQKSRVAQVPAARNGTWQQCLNTVDFRIVFDML